MHLPKPLFFILIATLILRIPNLFEPYWYGDEGIYLTVGEGIRQGLSLYREIYDHKPPGIFWLAAIAGSIFWFKVILLLWHMVTVVLFWKLSGIIFEKKTRGVIMSTGIFALLTTLPFLEGNIANGEIFMIGPVIGALVMLLGAIITWQRLLLAGALFSVAALIKPPALLDAAALVVFLVAMGAGQWKGMARSVAHSIILGIGITVPILLVSFYFFSQGLLTDFLGASFLQNVSYLSAWGIPTLAGQDGAIQFGLPFRSIVLAFSIIGILIFQKFFDKTTLFASIWFVFAVFNMLLSGRPYPHYIIQAVPPFAILVTILLLGREKYRFLTVPFLLIFLTSLVFYKFYNYPVLPYYQNFLSFSSGQRSQEEYFRYFDSRVPTTYKLAEVVASRTTSQDRIFIWGTMPELYALTHRLPPGRYVTSFHIGDFKGKDETLKSLQNNPPRYIIRVREEKRPFPGFDSFLYKNYLYLETVDGVEIWKLASPKTIKALSF